jgi:hypothetical protein
MTAAIESQLQPVRANLPEEEHGGNHVPEVEAQHAATSAAEVRL